MASQLMKRVRYTAYPLNGGWGYVITIDGKQIKDSYGFLTQKDAEAAGYKEKQRIVSKIQRQEIKL